MHVGNMCKQANKQAQAAHLTTGASKQGSKPKQANETQPYRQANRRRKNKKLASTCKKFDKKQRETPTEENLFLHIVFTVWYHFWYNFGAKNRARKRLGKRSEIGVPRGPQNEAKIARFLKKR